MYMYMDTMSMQSSIYELTQMSVKKAASQQYRDIVDRAAQQMAGMILPPEGWLRTVRKALGMSGAQLAKRLGVTRARVAQAETAELFGGVTLKTMEAAAAAMGCRFIYAVVPPKRIDEIIAAQAKKNAMAVVGTASKHMALESQAMSNDQIELETERIARDLIHEMSPDFWDDK